MDFLRLHQPSFKRFNTTLVAGGYCISIFIFAEWLGVRITPLVQNVIGGIFIIWLLYALYLLAKSVIKSNKID